MTDDQLKMFSHSVSNPPEGDKKDLKHELRMKLESILHADVIMNKNEILVELINDINDLLQSQRKELVDKIHENWEVGIRFSENNEEGTILDRNVMDNHLRMSKEEFINLIQEKGK